MYLWKKLAASWAVVAGVAYAAPMVEAYAGAVAGTTNFGPLCTTYGVQEPVPKTFFGGVTTPLGGIGACGYVGGINDVTAGGGAVSTSRSVSHAWERSSFSGQGAASAQSGMLASSASGAMTGETSSTYLHTSGGFSRFLEPAKFTSSVIAEGMSGFLELLFTVEGMSEHRYNPPYTAEIISSLFVRIRPGDQPRAVFYLKLSNGTDSFTTPPQMDNIVRTPGKASGSALMSVLFPFVWGEQLAIEAGLSANIYPCCFGVTSASDWTAKLTGIRTYDGFKREVADFTVMTGSGAVWTRDGVQTTVPEPGTMALAGVAGAVLLGLRRKRA